MLGDTKTRDYALGVAARIIQVLRSIWNREAIAGNKRPNIVVSREKRLGKAVASDVVQAERGGNRCVVAKFKLLKAVASALNV